MEIKMKLVEAMNINGIVKKIIDNDSNKKIDSLFKFKLLGIMKTLEPHISNFDVIRNDKIKEYGTTDEEGNTKIDPEDSELVKKFTEEIDTILLSDITVSVDKLKAKDVFDKNVPSEYLVGLYGIMEE